MDSNINKLIISLIQNEPFMYNKMDPNYVKKKMKKYAVFEVISQAVYVSFHRNMPCIYFLYFYFFYLINYKKVNKKYLF